MTAQTKCLHYCSLNVTYNREDNSTTPNTVKTVLKVEVDIPTKDAIINDSTDLQVDAVAIRLTAIEDCANEAEGRAWTGELRIKDLQNQCKEENVSNYYCNLLMALKSLEQEDDVPAETKQKVFVYSATEVENCSLKFYWKQKLEPFGLVRYGPILLKKVSFIRCCMDNLSEMLITINEQRTIISQRRNEIKKLWSENATLVNMLNSMSTEKQDHEKQLLKKFVCILNEKKKRIQSQQNINTKESLPVVKHKSTAKNIRETKNAKRSLSCNKSSSAKRKTGMITEEQSLNVGLKEVNQKIGTKEVADTAVINPYELDTQIDSPESPVLSWATFDSSDIKQENSYQLVSDNHKKSITMSATIVNDGRQTAAVCSTSNNVVVRETSMANNNAQSNDVHQEKDEGPMVSSLSNNIQKNAINSVMEKLWCGIGDNYN